MTRYRSLVLDVDSTLCDIEGVDWLARRRGGDVGQRIAALTGRAMNGEIALEAVYGERLALLQPTTGDVRALADAYRASVLPGAREAVSSLRAVGVRVVLVSGGIEQAIAPLAEELGVELRAVALRFGADGSYAGVSPSPLTTQGGKLEVVNALRLERPAIAVGDGSTDTAVRPAVDRFVAFTGVVRRDAVVAQSDAEIASFAELATLLR